jgi:ankyrin repeat protein
VKAISSNLLDINPRMNINKFNVGSAVITDTFNNGFTPLHHAAMQEHLAVVKYFTKCLLEKNPSEDNDKSVMYLAAEEQQLEIVEHYLDILSDGKKNPKANAIDDAYKGRTPLHAAAQSSSLEIIKAINAHLTDINPGDAHGYTPLHLASEDGHLHIVRYLIDQIKDINPPAYDFFVGATLYYQAASHGYLDIVELYLQKLPKSDVNPGLRSTNPVYQGKTPLHAAAENGYLDIVKAISKHLTNLSPKNALGTTPLILAVENGHLAIVKYFVETLKDINPAGGEFYKNRTLL